MVGNRGRGNALRGPRRGGLNAGSVSADNLDRESTPIDPPDAPSDNAFRSVAAAIQAAILAAIPPAHGDHLSSASSSSGTPRNKKTTNFVKTIRAFKPSDSEALEDWLDHVKTACQMDGFNDMETATTIMLNLPKSHLAEFKERLNRMEFPTIDTFLDAVKERLSPKKSAMVRETNFMACYPSASELPDDYLNRLRKLALKAYSQSSNTPQAIDDAIKRQAQRAYSAQHPVLKQFLAVNLADNATLQQLRELVNRYFQGDGARRVPLGRLRSGRNRGRPGKQH